MAFPNRELCALLDELVYTAGDRACSGAELLLMIQILAEKRTFGSIPEGKDRVLISDTFNLKPSGVSTLYLLGVKEGSFPAYSRVSGIFTGEERRFLRSLNVELPGDEDRAVYDEEYQCYAALTLPKDELYVTFPQKDLRGNVYKPSEIFEMLERFGGKGDQEEDLLFGRAICFEEALKSGLSRSRIGNQPDKAGELCELPLFLYLPEYSRPAGEKGRSRRGQRDRYGISQRFGGGRKREP